MRPGSRRSRHRAYLYSGVALVGFGLLLLAAGVAYYAYRPLAHSNLDELIAQVEPQATENVATPTPAVSSDSGEVTLRDTASPPSEAVAPSPTLPPTPPESATAVYYPTGMEQRTLFPGDSVAAYAWADPLGAAPPNPQLASLLEGFLPVDPDTAFGTIFPVATRILIPQIDVDAGTKELTVLNLGDSLAYETPANIVGHIPGTASPGQKGNGWYFGHLESPIKGEGNVFGRLPDIPRYLKNGTDVQVILQAGDRLYLYRVVRTEVVRAEDIRITESTAPVITLVTCVPRFYYDNRLLVTAELVGVKSLRPQ